MCSFGAKQLLSVTHVQVVSKHDYSKAADVYSFGIILWEVMTWQLPWEDLNPFQVHLCLHVELSQTLVTFSKLFLQVLRNAPD